MDPYYFFPDVEQRETKRQAAPVQPSLHSVRKTPAKPWKKPVAPSPPRVYRVEPINFRKVVQQLTGAPQIRPRRLQTEAPPPLNLIAPPLSNSDITTPLQLFSSTERPSSGVYHDLPSQAQGTKSGKCSGGSSLATGSFSFSPTMSPYTWCSFPLLSPGTLASLEQSTVPY